MATSSDVADGERDDAEGTIIPRYLRCACGQQWEPNDLAQQRFARSGVIDPRCATCRGERDQRRCDHCNQWFAPASGYQVLCSPACRAASQADSHRRWADRRGNG